MPIESELEAELAYVAAIVASSDDAIVSKSLDGLIRSWNAGAEHIFGYSADEAIGRSITLIIPEELRDEERVILAKLRNGQRIEHFETERQTKDGRRIPVSLTVSPVRNADGVIIGASKIARDISDRRRGEAAVREAQEHVALEAVALGKLNDWSSRLWRCISLDQGLHQMLDAAIELLGAKMGNIQLREGRTLGIRAHRGFQQDFLETFREVSEEEECACGRALRKKEFEIIEDVEADVAYAPFLAAARKAGYRTVVSAPLLTGEGTVLGVLSVHFDAVHRPAETDLKRLGLYLRQASDFVQRCMMEDTLRRNEQFLQDANQRKNEFLATLAHEMRNPLAPLRSCLQVLKLAKGDPKVIDQVSAMMERQVEHMVRLVDDLMDVGRIGQGKLDLRKESIDLNSIVIRASELCRERMDAKSHVFRVECAPGPLWVEGDSIRLVQVFSNLLNNASKYTSRAGEIAIRTERDGSDAVVRVVDTGIGIPQHMLDSVFDLFTQEEDSRDKSQGGVGIGLSLVKGLIEAHGGSVVARSEGRDRGSEFIVRLPMAVDSPMPQWLASASTA